MSSDIAAVLAVMFGGAFGAIMRHFLIDGTHRIAGQAHYGTFLVNSIGCFVMGCLFSVVLARELSESWRLFLITGFLGALTTFSTFSLDTIKLFQDGRVGHALGYVVASNLSGLLLCVGGYALVGRFMNH